MINVSEISVFLIRFSTFRVNEFVKTKNLISMMILLTATISFSLNANAGNMENCLLEAIKEAKNDVTIGEVREECATRFNQKAEDLLSDGSTNIDKDPIARRIELEKGVEINPFVLTAHKPNYFLPFAYNFDPNNEPFQSELGDKNMDNAEVKFQVSLKFPVWKGLYKDL